MADLLAAIIFRDIKGIMAGGIMALAAITAVDTLLLEAIIILAGMGGIINLAGMEAIINLVGTIMADPASGHIKRLLTPCQAKNRCSGFKKCHKRLPGK